MPTTNYGDVLPNKLAVVSLISLDILILEEKGDGSKGGHCRASFVEWKRYLGQQRVGISHESVTALEDVTPV